MNTTDRSLSAGGRDRYLPVPTANVLPYDLAYHAPDDDDDRIDLRSLWSAVYRNRWLILTVVALSLIAGIASLMLIPPTYSATASVEIDQQPVKVLGTEDADPAVSGTEMDRFLQTQVDVLNSRALAERVAESLNLFTSDAFLRAAGQTPKGDMDEEARHGIVVGALQSHLNVDLPHTTRVAQITFQSRDPGIAAAVANSYAENFIQSNLQRRFDTSRYSRSFLQNQLNLTKVKLEQSERSLIAYARSAGLIDASTGATEPGKGDGPRSLTTANLVQLNDAYSTARAARVQAQQRWQQASAAPLMSLPEVLANPAIQQMTQRRAELEAAYQQDLQHRLPDHPIVQQEAAQLKELENQIKTLAASIRSSIRDQYMTAQRQESALAGNVGQLKGATLSEQDRGIRYNILKREVDTNRELYDGLLQRYKEISAQAGITSNNISIVDRAQPSGVPVFPKPVMNVGLAGAGGLVLALLIVFAREMFDDSVRTPEDVDQKLGLPLLGSVPKLSKNSSPLTELLEPRSALAEAYHAIRASIDLSSAEGAPATLLITSSRESEGKSTTAIALALDFAASGKSVLLVDGDMRRPSLHQMLGLSNQLGLSNLLAQQRGVDELIQATEAHGLSFLSAGPIPPNPAMLLARKHLATVLTTLSSRFDHIVIDSPPVLGLADAAELAAVADGTVFVIEANRAHRGYAKLSLRRLLATRANLLGAILTKFDPRKAGYGVDYSSYYGARGGELMDAGGAPVLSDASDGASGAGGIRKI